MSFALNFTPLDEVYFKKAVFVSHPISNKGVSISLIFVALLAILAILISVIGVIALPLSWYVVNSWLSSFEHKVDMSAWIFLAAGLLISLISIIIVTLKSYRTATINPAEAMKY